ncbi:MAG: asparagine synthase (glutamine-hydrolyzing) [Bacteriovoracaceae bacterium]
MCGIFGIINLSNNSSVDEASFRRALVTLNHRGPDHQGLFSDPKFTFGHARLSILDLDPRSNQPMTLDNENYILTFNGEIYNYQAIKKELLDQGHQFKTESDTEVILIGYLAWGIDKFLEKTQGMFAFALMDKKEDKLLLVRDRYGKKPFFYHFRQDQFGFASELAPLFKYFPKFNLNASGLDSYLTLNFSPFNSHLVDGIEAVPPGHYGVLDLKSKNLSFHRYWNIFINTTERVNTYSVDELEQELERAVSERLISDVPVCGFLSGGIDSSLISALVAKNTDRPYRTYCIGYEGQERYNEFEYADIVAKKFNLDHHNITVTLDDAKKTLMSVGDLLDEPISNWVWVPLHLLSNQVKQDGYKVVLVGEGADELFHGYNSFAKALNNLDSARTSSWKYTIPHNLFGWSSKYISQGHRRFDLWRRVAEGDPVYMNTSFGITKTLRNQLAGKNLLDLGDPSEGYNYIKNVRSDLARITQGNFDNVDLIAYTEIYSKMIEVLVRRVDRISMLNSIEARAPFLDHKIAELVFKTMGYSRIDGNVKKAWLKKVAAKYIPNECIDRKKMGFSFPFEQWLYGDMGNVVHERFQESKIFKDGWLNQEYCLGILKDHRSKKRDYAPRIWSLYTLATWYDRWM